MDIEANGFLHVVTRIHCAVFRDLKGKVVKRFTPDTLHELPNFMDGIEILIGHNILSYDLPVILKILKYTYTGKKVDTLLMSRLLNPKRMLPFNALDKRAGPHSLYAWGVRVGIDKPEHSDWENYSEAMLHRCEEDTHINVLTYHKLLEEAANGNWMPAFKLTFRLFECLQKQEEYGWKVDLQYMHFLLGVLDRAVSRIDRKIIPNLPTVVDVLESKIKGEYNHIKKPFNKSGAYSKAVIDFFGDTSKEILSRHIAGPFSRIAFRPVDVNSNAETKDYLLSLGWEPLEWNTNDEGERTSPKLSKEDPFEGLQGTLGKLIARRVQCRQRRSIIAGLINIVRDDGAIPSVINNLADTSRMTHRNIVNIPKGGSFFGKQMRKMFIARDGKVLVSTDADSCQLRMLGGRTGDPDYINAIVTGDKSQQTDLHSLTRKIAGLESRDIAKNTMYCMLFAGGDGKLGKVAGKPGQGAEIRQKLYQGFTGLGEHIEEITKEWRNTARKRWNAKWNKMEYFDGTITGIDGRPVRVPAERQLLVYELQSDEAITISATYVKIFHELSKKYTWGEQWGIVCVMHDEVNIECDPEIAEDVARISRDAITWAGNHFKIRCPLVGDSQIGKSWYEIH